MSEQNYIERYWRDATPEDAIEEPPMVARFKDEHYKDWVVDKLIYWDRSETPWHRDDGHCYERCQVYDAPDPGEGWRLIDVDKETPKMGDELLVHPGQWKDRGDCHGCFEENKFYRRRIEQPKPKPKYVPFTWEDREQLRGRWITREKDGYVIEEIAYRFDSRAFEVVAKNLLQDWKFLDTGEPVGRKVQ